VLTHSASLSLSPRFVPGFLLRFVAPVVARAVVVLAAAATPSATAGDDARTFLDVPRVTATDAAFFRGMFESSSKSVVRVAILGDSQETAPAGFGREYVDGTGNVERERAFYIIDRTVPVGFVRGEDLNTDKTILLQRTISGGRR
jgi:hypothetical protein